MENDKPSIPENMTIEQATLFWDAQSVASFPSRIIKMEYAPKERRSFIPINKELFSELQEYALKQDTTIEALVNLWIKEKLDH